MDDLIQSLLDDLSAELSITDENFNQDLLKVKIQGALREVLQELGYSGLIDYETYLASKVDRYYSNIRNIALYDYNMVGGEFSKTLTESDTKREVIDRNTLFYGIYPKAHIN